MNIDNLSNSLNKFKGLFTKAQKEIFHSGDGKRNLYFDYNRKYFLKFSLDVSTTCENIFKIHKDEIIRKVRAIHGNNIDLNNFAFLIVELNSNKLDGSQNLINLKLRMDENNINRILFNSQLMICYLLMNKQNIACKKNARILGLLNPINYVKMDNGEIEEKREKQDIKKSKNIKTYLSKGTIFYYNNKMEFSKEKITITEKEVFISSTPNYRLLIKDIKQISTFLSTDGKDIVKYLKYYQIFGEKPVFCIEVVSKPDKKLLIGRNSYDSFMVLYKALESASNNYQNDFCHLDYNGKIFQYHSNLFYLSNCILKTTSSLDELVIDKAKRKILFKDCKDKELVDIVSNIMDFKNNFNKRKYKESINNIKNIKNIFDKIIQEKKYQDIINEDNTDFLNKILDKIKELHLFDNENYKPDKNEINNSNNNVSSKEKELAQSYTTNKNNVQNRIENKNNEVKDMQKVIIKNENNLSEEQEKELNNLLNINSLDEIYTVIKQKYISQYYEQKLSNKNLNSFHNNLKLLLGNYISNSLEMKEEKDILYLGGDEFEKTINDFNEKLIAERLENIKDAQKYLDLSNKLILNNIIPHKNKEHKFK